MKKALVLGGTGMLGYGVSESLLKNGWGVRVFSNGTVPDNMILEGAEYVFGDINNAEELNAAMAGVDSVFYFISTSFPKESSLTKEITVTCMLLEKVIESMRACGVKSIIYPSSGGTVYGSLTSGFAKESDPLNPSSPYGTGKVMNEEMLKYYSKHGINALVLRIGNVYGSSLYRSKPQGAIDVFTQNILTGQDINIWGDIEGNERDYIFIDDLADATAFLAEKGETGFSVYNLGSGVATSLKDILDELKAQFDKPLTINIEDAKIEGDVSRIVLDITKLTEAGFKHKYDLKTGIVETIRRKKKIINGN